MPIKPNEKIIDARTVIDEIASETIKIYNDYPHMSIFQAVLFANEIIEGKYKDYEIVEGD